MSKEDSRYGVCTVCDVVDALVWCCVYQTIELSSKYSEYLTEEVSSFYAYNFIQLVLVSWPHYRSLSLYLLVCSPLCMSINTQSVYYTNLLH